jgi:hypothetical protein
MNIGILARKLKTRVGHPLRVQDFAWILCDVLRCQELWDDIRPNISCDACLNNLHSLLVI